VRIRCLYIALCLFALAPVPLRAQTSAFDPNEAGWKPIAKDRFRVMFEGRTDAQFADRVTGVLKGAFWRIGHELRSYPTDTVWVILYTEKQFRDITRAPEWTDGVYDGRIRIPVDGATRNPALFERVLAHELAHAMVAAIARHGVPAWMHEGLAQHFEGVDLEAAKRRLRATERRIPLDRLDHSLTDLPAADVGVAYDESLLAVDAIRMHWQFNWTQLLSALADSESPSETLRRFGVTYADLEKASAR
jgi:hypothetical protein